MRLPLFLPLNECFRIVYQVDIEHVEMVQVIQVEVEYNMQLLLDLLFREAKYVVVTVDESSHVFEEFLFVR